MEKKILCLYCGVFEEKHKADRCFEDLAKDLLMDVIPKETLHYWTEGTLAKDWYWKKGVNYGPNKET